MLIQTNCWVIICSLGNECQTGKGGEHAIIGIKREIHIYVYLFMDRASRKTRGQLWIAQNIGYFAIPYVLYYNHLNKQNWNYKDYFSAHWECSLSFDCFLMINICSQWFPDHKDSKIPHWICWSFWPFILNTTFGEIMTPVGSPKGKR